MRGSTRKRGRTWTAYYDIPADLETGARKQKTKGGLATRKAAEGSSRTSSPSSALARTRSRQSSRSRHSCATVAPSRPRTVATADRREVRAGHAHARHRPRHRLHPATATHAAASQRAVRGDGAGRAECRDLPGVHAVIGRALTDAVKWGCSGATREAGGPASAPISRASAWSATELRRFLAHVETERLFAVWRLGATTGMRRGELLGLTWRALELDRARLQVTQQLIPTKGGCTFGPPKSKRGADRRARRGHDRSARASPRHSAPRT